MAKKTNNSSKDQHQLESQDRKARQREVEDKYGEVRFTSSYDLSEYLVSEMSLLLGSEQGERQLSVISFILCLLIVIVLWRFPGNPVSLTFAVVMVVAAMVSMSATSALPKLKLRYLRKHGYDTQAMTDQQLARELYVTKDQVVTVVPGISTEAWAFGDLKRVRNNEDFLLADFGNGRLALFPRRTLSLNNYTALTSLLKSHAPQTIGERRAARKDK